MSEYMKIKTVFEVKHLACLAKAHNLSSMNFNCPPVAACRPKRWRFKDRTYFDCLKKAP